MNEKRLYERPQMTVVRLQVQSQLLTGSELLETEMNVVFEEENWDE